MCVSNGPDIISLQIALCWLQLFSMQHAVTTQRQSTNLRASSMTIHLIRSDGLIKYTISNRQQLGNKKLSESYGYSPLACWPRLPGTDKCHASALTPYQRLSLIIV